MRPQRLTIIISRKYSMICLAEDGRKKVRTDGILLDTVSKGENVGQQKVKWKVKFHSEKHLGMSGKYLYKGKDDCEKYNQNNQKQVKWSFSFWFKTEWTAFRTWYRGGAFARSSTDEGLNSTSDTELRMFYHAAFPFLFYLFRLSFGPVSVHLLLLYARCPMKYKYWSVFFDLNSRDLNSTVQVEYFYCRILSNMVWFSCGDNLVQVIKSFFMAKGFYCLFYYYFQVSAEYGRLC